MLYREVPSISDDYASIKRYACVPWETRDRYHRARVDAMLGRGTAEAALAILRAMNVTVHQHEQGGDRGCLSTPSTTS